MAKDPFDPYGGITSRLFEQDEILKGLTDPYPSVIAQAAAGIANYLRDPVLAASYGTELGVAARLAQNAIVGTRAQDVLAARDVFGASHSALYRADIGATAGSAREALLGTGPHVLPVATGAYDVSRTALAHIANLGLPSSVALNLGTTARDIALLAAGGGVYDVALPSHSLLSDRFLRPELDMLSQIGRTLQEDIKAIYGLNGPDLFASLHGIQQPWLDVRDTAKSMMGFARLQGIGHLIDHALTFDVSVASILRSDLGDWRDPITWPSGLGSDVSLRAGLYLERGFNPALTEFPVEAFDEGLEAAGLQDDRPALVIAYGEAVPVSADPETETAFARNNQVHDWLQRFESQIRRFIDDAMTLLYGSDWPRHRLPNGMYDKWLDKKRRDSTGRDWPLINYADFTDYELLICRTDNWRGIFHAHFTRPELVRESLQRLYPTRLATMHARPLLPEDELFAYAEIKRLVGCFILKGTA
ncbi:MULTISPECIES: hypothetical protein [unclassified Mesorhizobium]|uniref:hypothetical protein n=1 Tax=unclassified Mesorhizobium TaxID=325217 RepID=UPI000FDC12D2|nr:MULTISPECIES: hypothetical protein [unclassified Mesorhizobium]TGR23151.1 hypothetical protein EN840_22105 [Mesorhizobium sp. M8A.F.Ca.ET.197.01.1.1]TGR39235.1 hypothetical protein EN842_42150 [bacterium M00.F.Ca.ET.199.01.1.1]TGR46830.1 hypothetical protein EN841_22100 [Mesorhizobium sp. M8A.F.Ca.ET.198.01.1.1]TGV85092.1 hypothetical protein EN792_018370 [Mesorhizobium sp. M00.F.Ca.ET.149.01.1.1]